MPKQHFDVVLDDPSPKRYQRYLPPRRPELTRYTYQWKPEIEADKRREKLCCLIIMIGNYRFPHPQGTPSQKRRRTSNEVTIAADCLQPGGIKTEEK